MGRAKPNFSNLERVFFGGIGMKRADLDLSEFR